MPRIARLSILGFVGGALAVLIFHQSLWFLFNHIGLIPPERPAWPLDPIPPLGVPSVISKAFWGGVWGAVLAPPPSRWRGGADLGGLDHRCGDCAAARRLLRGAADQRRLRSGTNRLPLVHDAQRQLGIWHGALPTAHECGAERLRWRKTLPSAGRKG